MCVVVVTMWESWKGLGTTPAATRPEMWAMSDIKMAFGGLVRGGERKVSKLVIAERVRCVVGVKGE